MQVNIYKIKKKYAEYNRPEYSQKQENFGMSIDVIAVRRRYLHTNIWSYLFSERSTTGTQLGRVNLVQQFCLSLALSTKANVKLFCN